MEQASRSQVPIAVPPLARRLIAARLAASRDDGPAIAIVPSVGNTAQAVLVPATTANAVPSCNTSMAAHTAVRADAIFIEGTSIDPEQSTMMISADLDSSAGAGAMSADEVTVTTAFTVRPPSGRNWFWSMSTVKLIREDSLPG